ncbi:DNA helicase RecD, partial [Streptomyces sp. MBT49]|nr:DNA helicase RecD [Streptomyces sp. MBT49]
MPGPRRRVGARAPLSRSRLEHAVSTEPVPPESTENAGAATPDAVGEPGTADATATAEPTSDATAARGAQSEAEAEADAAADAEPADQGDAAKDASEGDGEATGEGGAAAQLSEAEAELAAQKLERERIERRKAEKAEPIASGAKLSGKAADLLAAVRAVEGGAKPPATVFDEPAPAPRRPAPEPVRR